MPASAAIITAKLAVQREARLDAYCRDQQPGERGPAIRAAWISTLLRLTAFTTRSAPTISITNACRVG